MLHQAIAIESAAPNHSTGSTGYMLAGIEKINNRFLPAIHVSAEMQTSSKSFPLLRFDFLGKIDIKRRDHLAGYL